MDEIHAVTLIGYEGEKCIDAVTNNPKIFQKRLSIPSFSFAKKISILHAGLRAAAMFTLLFQQLITQESYDIVLIQNPPCLPAAIVSAIMSTFNGSKIIIDWHNLGFKMFEERHGPKHVLVKFSRALEHAVAKISYANICVSNAMSRWLGQEFNIPVSVVYDKPANIFSRIRPDIEVIHNLFLKLNFTDEMMFPTTQKMATRSSKSTIQTEELDDGTLQWRQHDLCPLIISSTSWTPDEDFNLFLNAILLLNSKLEEIWLQENNQHVVSGMSETQPLRALVAITGKGPQRAEFEHKIKNLEDQGKLRLVRIRTVWLESQGNECMHA